ncbi:DNA repair protein RecO [Paracerasibacillus soli]|uniref:DNA repair protein RecO n=1 Tax=Paracerasibacillus soli TaxID=480284 RepID=A0ABU5CQ39_9BACI|nr:DNA repair protein RecO [Virgibacillus soli]MDY0408469.1 DNA repair protein RecO [Virgibacillus soli]
MLEKVKGFIIKTQDYGETHKIVTLFGQHTGKITAIARGAKKPKSRMAAVTQPFIYGEFLVYVTSNLGTMQQGDIVESFRNIREDLVKTAYTAYVMELTDKLLDQKVPYDYLLMELYETCCWIAENKDASYQL